MTQRRRKSRKPQEDIRKQQAAKDQQEVIALAGADWEKQVAERDEKIAALEVQAAEVAKNAKVAEALRGEIAELKAQGESDRIDFKLQLAGVRSMRYTFGSCAFTTIDSRGFDPSTLIHVLGLLRYTPTRPGRCPRAASRARGASTRVRLR